jgi:hypothetical protein
MHVSQCDTMAHAWSTLAELYSSQTRAVARGRGSFGGRGSGGSSRGNSRGRGHGHGPSRGGFNNQSGKSSRSDSGSSSCPQCQLCLKIGHSAKCWYRYEEDSSFEPCHAALATTSDVDNNWYTDSGATDHITGDLDKLTMNDTYLGNDQIHTKNGSDMNTTRIGNTIIPTSSRNLVLNNVLHVAATHKNLISIYLFTLDNNTDIKFHPYFFLDQGLKNEEVAVARSI